MKLTKIAGLITMIDTCHVVMILSFIMFVCLIFYLFKQKVIMFIDQHIKNIANRIQSSSIVKEESFKKLQIEKDHLAELDHELHKIELDTHNMIEIYSNDLKEKTRLQLMEKRKEIAITMEKMEKEFERSLRERLVDLIFQKIHSSIENINPEYIDHFLEDHLNKITKKLN